MITVSRILELCDVDLVAGTMRWKKIEGKVNPYANKLLGTLNDSGYLVARIDGRLHRVHRLIAMVGGMDVNDEIEIDHINGDRKDNRISNLRLASRKENGRNTKRPKTNSSGVKGVDFHSSGLWRARVKIAGKDVLVGYFNNLDEAAKARREFVERLHGQFARHD